MKKVTRYIRMFNTSNGNVAKLSKATAMKFKNVELNKTLKYD